MINTYTHPNLLFETEIASFTAQMREPTLHELRADVDTAIRARDEFVNAYFPHSAKHYLRFMAVAAMGVPLCSAAALGGLFSGSVALSHTINACFFGHLPSEGAFMSSRWVESLVATLGTALAGGLLYKGSEVMLHLLKIDEDHSRNENRKCLQQLNGQLSTAYRALAEAIGKLPESSLAEAIEQHPVPPAYLLEAVGKDDQKLFFVMEHILDRELQRRSNALVDDRVLETIQFFSDGFVKTLDEPDALLKRLSDSPAPEHVLAMMAVSSLGPITDVPPPLREYLEAHPDVLQKTVSTMLALADGLHIPGFLKPLQEGRNSGIPQTFFDMNRRLNGR